MINSVVVFTTATLALIFACVLGVSGIAEGVHFQDDVMVVEWDARYSGVSFGGLAFTDRYNESHEIGHAHHARELGFLYLPVVGLPSLISAVVVYIDGDRERHYNLWFERWADDIR